MIRAQAYPVDQIIPLLGKSDAVLLDGDWVPVCSARLLTFIKGTKCVVCGCEGAYWVKEKHNATDRRFHLNLYAIVDEQGGRRLMTSDHIWPVSKGGSNCVENRQPMCSTCNNKKSDLTPTDGTGIKVEDEGRGDKDRKARSTIKDLQVLMQTFRKGSAAMR